MTALLRCQRPGNDGPYATSGYSDQGKMVRDDAKRRASAQYSVWDHAAVWKVLQEFRPRFEERSVDLHLSCRYTCPRTKNQHMTRWLTFAERAAGYEPTFVLTLR